MSNKIVITGHTSGIGKAIYDKFTEVSCREIVGMSRSTGYDIEKDFDKIIESIEKGETPFFVGATCGTTLLGAYDSLDEIAIIDIDTPPIIN